MDKMYIHDLVRKCIIGTRPAERKRKQFVVLNICLTCNLAKAGRTDRLDDTVNYQKLTERITELVETSRFLLIERLADRVAAICLDTPGVKSAIVNLRKPAAIPGSHGAAVEIRRGKRV
jgi:D-erythro-7,8-dihydroneopterin triphosphate epimerase